MKADGTITVSAEISNTGKYAGTEIVQLYVRDLVGTTTRPVKELKGFKRIWLEPGEKEKVLFSLSCNELAVLDKEYKPVVEPGKFNVWISSNSGEGLMGEFEIIK